MEADNMRPVISSALIVLMILSSAEVISAFEDNNIVQNNDARAYAIGTGSIYEKNGNWAVACGDANIVHQDNIQDYSANIGKVDERASNIALAIGLGNDVRQLNDPGRIWVAPPSEINLRQLNEMLCLGKDNDANQTNWAYPTILSASCRIDQDQTNFGVIFGGENNLAQYNLADGLNSGDGALVQTEANSAYVYGEKNRVDQKNLLDADALAYYRCGAINQTAKNLAFAISSCPIIEYIPGCESFTLRPGCSCSSQTLNCPGIPEAPCPPELTPEFQLDP
jgi:hypothetical protein